MSELKYGHCRSVFDGLPFEGIFYYKGFTGHENVLAFAGQFVRDFKMYLFFFLLFFVYYATSLVVTPVSKVDLCFFSVCFDFGLWIFVFYPDSDFFYSLSAMNCEF